MKDKVMPSLVLTVICIIAAVLLTFAHEMTKDRIADQKAQKFNSSVELLFGKTESKVVQLKCGVDEIQTIAVTPDKKTVIQVCTDGYKHPCWYRRKRQAFGNRVRITGRNSRTWLKGT